MNRPTVRFVVLLLLGGSLSCASACSSAHTAVCVPAQLSVAVTENPVTIRVSGPDSGCVFSGRHPVSFAWLVGGAWPQPPNAKGRISRRTTYVQPYKIVGANGCPAVDESGDKSIGVSVEGSVISATVPAGTAHELQACLTLSPERPRLEAA